MANPIGAAYKVDRPLYAAYLRTSYEHALPNVDGTFQNLVDVHSCCFIYHNEHSYNMSLLLCHAFSKKNSRTVFTVLLHTCMYDIILR